MKYYLKATRKTKWITLLILFIIIPLSADKYAGEIFHFPMGVRNLALGSTGHTNINSSSIAWWNPALLPYVEDNSIEIMHAEEYAGLLKYDCISGIWGRRSKFALVISRIAIDDIPLTVLEDETQEPGEDNQPYAYKYVNNSDLIAYFGFFQNIKSVFLGFTPKLAWRNLADETGFGFGADISISSNPTKDLIFAAQIRDFFTTSIFWSNDTKESVSPNANLESSYGFLFFNHKFPMRIFLRTEFLFEDRDEAATFSLNILSLDIHAGLETSFSKHFDLLFGYDVDHFTTGIALKYENAGLLYSFELESELDNSHRIAVTWSF